MPTPPPAAATHPQPASSRLAEPVHFSSRCFVADCAVGSLVTDALCSWSESATSREHPYSDQAGAAGFEVCLLRRDPASCQRLSDGARFCLAAAGRALAGGDGSAQAAGGAVRRRWLKEKRDRDAWHLFLASTAKAR